MGMSLLKRAAEKSLSQYADGAQNRAKCDPCDVDAVLHRGCVAEDGGSDNEDKRAQERAIQ